MAIDSTPARDPEEKHESLIQVIRRSPPLLLLMVLLADIILSPMIGGWATTALNVTVILGCLGIVANDRRGLKIGLWLTVPAILFIIAGEVTGDRRVNLAAYPFTLLLYLHIIRLMFKTIFRTKVVTLDTIGLALCTYVLLGVLWVLFYIPVLLYDQNAFVFANLPPDGDVMKEMTYFSYVTLTTLGYGDVAPVSPLARGLAVTEALTGVLFLAVLISRLVGSFARR